MEPSNNGQQVTSSSPEAGSKYGWLLDVGKWSAIGGVLGTGLIYVLTSDQAASVAGYADLVAAIGGCVVAAAVGAAAALRKRS